MWTEQFIDMFNKLPSKNNDIILLGDFNFDLLNPNQEWENALNLLGLKQIINEPTRVTQNSKTLIDHIYTNNTNKISSPLVIKSSISDHYPIFCNL